MIIKFDHISYSTNNKYEYRRFVREGGYNVLFSEYNLTNAENKKILMNNFTKTHDVIFLQKEGLFPIEFQVYNNCFTREPLIQVCGDSFYLKVSDLKKTEKLLTCIGATLQGENVYALKPMMDKKEIIIQIIKVDHYVAPAKLDEEGWSSIAFWTNDIEKEYDMLFSAGFDVSPISSLCVNCKNIKLFWVTNGEGLIIEFLGIDVYGKFGCCI